MTWFSNLKTMSKLVLGFVFTAAIIVTMSGLGANGLLKLRENLRIVYADYTTAATDLATCSNNLTRFRNNAVQITAAPDKSEFDTLMKEQDPLRAEMLEILTKYSERPLRVSRTGRNESQDLAAFDKGLKNYFEAGWITFVHTQKALESTNETERKEFRDKARLNTIENSGPKLTEATLALDRLLTTVTEIAKDMNEDGATTAQTGLQILGVGTAFAIVVCLTLGFYLARTISHSENAMRETLNEVSLIAEGLSSASRQLSAASQEISSGAQEQASNLEETASSLEEITSTVKQNADNAQQANQLASRSREVAEKGGQVVQNAVNGMHEINAASKQIADIITVIDEIAFQTNLLALNAAVEAARAGEQGRGFAVVAGEVRNLAQRSAGAAKEIKGLIQDSVRKVEAGSALVNQSGETLQEIVTSVKRVTDIVGEIAAASREQSTGVEQVSKAVAQMDQVTQTNASQTEELSGTAESLAGQAQQLQDLLVRNNTGKTTAAATRPPTGATTVRRQPQKYTPRRTATGSRGITAPQSITESAGVETRVENDLDLIAAGVGNDGFAEF